MFSNGEDSVDDEIVISGMSGRFPESSNVEEFKKHLLDGIDLITDDDRRWPPGYLGLSSKFGKLKDLASFDANFFGVHAKQAEVMDPQIRLLLELTYEAILDAGINPTKIRGSRTGVYVGVGQTESMEFWLSESDTVSGYVLSGCCSSMFANRISYSFDFKGPSFSVDSACSSSLSAMNLGVAAIRDGYCDSAIIGGVTLLLRPKSSLIIKNLGMMSSDGTCKSFDGSGNGYVRAEATSIILLQKSRNARRVYATVVHSKSNSDGYKDQGITFPSGKMQNELMREVYKEAGINPNDVTYVEAHGTGTSVGDPEEVNSIAELFCKNRKEPLLIGSVKSNMGHAEAASGLCSIVKVLLAMETGVIPGNLHFKNPNPDIPSLSDGRIKVVDKSMPWKGGLMAVNSFGFGGVNIHILLRSNPKPKITQKLDVNLPKIVVVSGRTEEAVNVFLDKVKENEKDDELISMVQDIHAFNIPGHGYRGFQILGETNIREIDEFSGEEKPIWYVFSGMGSQWSGMGRSLLSIDTFQNSLRRCAAALKPEGVDLMNLILHGTNETFENVVNSFVSIAAIQVALVDVLSLIGIEPNGIVGHSVGELGCGYADGGLTAEQTVLAAYWRGRSILESNLPKGSMAAIGLSWEETQKRCPPDVFPVCHNSADSVTVSGPPESVTKFVEELKEEEIFAKQVHSSGVAFHSKYIAPSGPKLRSVLEKIIPNPKPRTSRWISSSIPESAWNTPLAQLCSPAYNVNNLLSPVLFHEALAHVPQNAIVIEIAPHCLLQAVLRRSLPPSVTNIGLQKREHSDNLYFLLTKIGKLYVSGGQPKLSKLYPPVTYPVGRGTPMINSMIKWDHSTAWRFPDFTKNLNSGQTTVEVDLSKESYLSGHLIDGEILFPFSGYLTIVWKTLAKLRKTDFKIMPIVFEDLQFKRSVNIPKTGSVKFLINILEGSGKFEISENESTVVTGKVRVPQDIEKEQVNLSIPIGPNDNLLELKTADIYTDLRIRGYYYNGIFQSIKTSDNRSVSGKLAWFDNWVSFLDSIFQFTILGQNTKDLFLPTQLEYAAINPVHQRQLVNNLQKDEGIPVYMYSDLGIVKSGGVEFRELKSSLVQRKSEPDSKNEQYSFIPYENLQSLSNDPEKANLHALIALLHTARENIGRNKIKAAEVTAERNPKALISPMVLDILLNELQLSVDMKLITSSPNNYTSIIEKFDVKTVDVDIKSTSIGHDLQLILTADILNNKITEMLKNLEDSLKPGGFILSEETTHFNSNVLKESGLVLVGKQASVPEKLYILLKKKEERLDPIIVQVTEKNFSWVERLKAELKRSEAEGKNIIVFSQGEELFGLIGFMNCLRKERGAMNDSYFFIQDENASKFSLSHTFYLEQLNKQLVANVLKNGKWGSYRHLPLENQNGNPSLQVEHAYINTLLRGNLNSLRWIESPLTYYQPENYAGQELCHVYYASLNYRDIMLATEKLAPDVLHDNVANQDGILGVEFAGRVCTTGRRVMGLVPARGLATTVLADPELTWEVPDKWTLQQASSIPYAYATSYYALIVRGRLKPRESVLIHSGSSGIGQASITIALNAGCTVFTTVSSNEKRDFLKKQFPQLTEKHFGNSRDTNFEQFIFSETKGKGVDLILNPLSDEKLQANIRCLAKNGRFLEFGKFDLSHNSGLETSFFLRNITFHRILLDALFDTDGPEKKEVVQLISDGIKNGVVRPLPSSVFNEQQIEQCFRFMTTGKFMSKVLIRIREEEPNKVTKPAPKTVAAIPKTYMNPKKSFIVVGGLGGFGLELTHWMITRGAKYIVLTSRSGIRSGYQSVCIRRWQEMGVIIQVSKTDFTTEAGAESLLKETKKLAPVGGIFNLAGVLKDGLIENLDEGDFEAVASPKVTGTKKLDSASRKYCPQLEYFVCFSSITCGRGTAGQSNYGLANSAMERIMEERQSVGLPGLAIQWGAIKDVGMLVETIGTTATELSGAVMQRILSCLEIMDFLLQQPYPVVATLILAEKRKTDDSTKQSNLLVDVANILGIKDMKNINMNSSLSDIGMDSLMQTEIKEAVQINCDIVLSPQEIRALTFGKLLELSSEADES